MPPDELPLESAALLDALTLRAQQALLERIERAGDDPLSSFLSHVQETVPYYRALAGDRRLQLHDYPLMDRETMRARRLELLSDAYRGCVTRNLVEYTNGTVAPMLEVSFDLAGRFESNQLLFARILDTRPELWSVCAPDALALCYVDDDPRRDPWTMRLAPLDGALLRRVSLYREHAEELTIARSLLADEVPLLIGKPHTLARLAERVMDLDESARLRPRALICSGENLYDSDRAWLVDWYRCPIINVYLSTEAGLIGIDCPHGRDFHVPPDRLVLELLQPDGTSTSEGSGELVITNVTNWAQPFVRYRQSDQVTLRRGACTCGFVGTTVTALSGRDALTLDVRGVGPVETARLAPLLARPELRQYEVARYPDGTLVVRYAQARGCAAAPLAAALTAALRPLLGDAFRLERVDDVTTWGTKLRHFVERPFPA